MSIKVSSIHTAIPTSSVLPNRKRASFTQNRLRLRQIWLRFSSCICIWKTFRAENICDQTRALGGVTPPPPCAEVIASKLSMPSPGGNPRNPPRKQADLASCSLASSDGGGVPPLPPRTFVLSGGLRPLSSPHFFTSIGGCEHFFLS